MSCPLFSVPKKLPTFVHPLLKRITRQRHDNSCVLTQSVTRVTPGRRIIFGRECRKFGQHKVSLFHQMRLRNSAPEPSQMTNSVSARPAPWPSLPISARPRAEGIYSRTLRRDGDLALLPRIRAGAPAIPARALACCRDHRRDGRLLGLPSINSSARRRNASGMVMPNDSPCRAIIAREADEVTSSSVSFREGDGYDVARKTHFRNCATVTSAPSVSQAPVRSASSDRLDPGKANAPPAPACGSR